MDLQLATVKCLSVIKTISEPSGSHQLVKANHRYKNKKTLHYTKTVTLPIENRYTNKIKKP